jgi:hypothetical protein
MSKPRCKERITVSLSKDSARFLHTLQHEEQSPSMSALLEKIVTDLQAKAQMESIEARMAAYYDALPETAMREDTAWADVGASALASLQDEEGAVHLVAAGL